MARGLAPQRCGRPSVSAASEGSVRPEVHAAFCLAPLPTTCGSLRCQAEAFTQLRAALPRCRKDECRRPCFSAASEGSVQAVTDAALVGPRCPYLATFGLAPLPSLCSGLCCQTKTFTQLRSGLPRCREDGCRRPSLSAASEGSSQAEIDAAFVRAPWPTTCSGIH